MSATEQHPDRTHQFWGPEVEVNSCGERFQSQAVLPETVTDIPYLLHPSIPAFR